MRRKGPDTFCIRLSPFLARFLPSPTPPLPSTNLGLAHVRRGSHELVLLVHVNLRHVADDVLGAQALNLLDGVCARASGWQRRAVSARGEGQTRRDCLATQTRPRAKGKDTVLTCVRPLRSLDVRAHGDGDIGHGQRRQGRRDAAHA